MKHPTYRALHIITRFGTGGAEESVLEQIRALDDLGFTCDLAIGKEFNPHYLKKHPLPEHTQIKRIPSLVRSPHPLYDIRAVQEIKTLIRQERYSIVHTHLAKAGILGRYAAYRTRTPIILHTVHGTSMSTYHGLFRSWIFTLLERRAARWCDALISVGVDLQNILLAHAIGKPEQHRVIYTGMTLDAFKKIHYDRVHDYKNYMRRRSLALQKLQDIHRESVYNTTNPTPYETRHSAHQKAKHISDETSRHVLGGIQDPSALFVGMIARFEKVKNHREFIEMLRPLLAKRTSVYVVLFGDGPEIATIQELVAHYQLENNIIFVGHVANIPEYLYGIDVNCLCSYLEGLPRVLVQCSAAGIPTVCFDVEGAKEIIEDKKSGFIINRIPHSAQQSRHEFVHALSYLLDTPQARHNMGTHATHNALSRWSLERLKHESITCYRHYIKTKLQ